MHTTKPNMVNYTTVIYTITVPARMLKLACNCPFNTVGVATYFHGHGTTNMVLEMNCHICSELDNFSKKLSKDMQ